MDKTEGTGERVGGYRVVRRLATGGTSNVLLAKAEGPHGFERSVVLKLLLPEYKHDAEFKGMFAREAAAYARLSHPSIVRLYDFFANDDQLVMVLEYIDGPPLSKLRGMLKAVGQQLDDTTAIYVASSIFAALAAAHGATDDTGEPAPVIHRDVNPSNVLIPWDGNVKLADFGVAKVTGASHQSNVGLIRGTFGYMAPEQVKGETVTPRADVYAGAIILWEMLTKRRAFIRGALPEIEVLRQLAEPRIVSIDVIRPDLDKSVRDAIKRALEPRGDKRTITAEEMASILRAVVPENDGREKLAKALAHVRHEPNPSATSIPPPVTMTFGGPDPSRYEPRAPMMTKHGLAPRVTPPPLPTVRGVSRQTAPYGATPPAAPVAAAASPRPPVVAPPRPATKPSEPPTVSREVAPTSQRGLAALLEPSESDPRPNLGVAASTASRSENAPARDLRDSIDDILRDIPSNVPPNMFPKTDPPGGIPAAALAPKDVDVLADPFARGLGELPPAPPMLDPSVPLNLGATLVDEPAVVATGPSSFPPQDQTLALARSPVSPPARPMPQVAQGVTAPMAAVGAGASPSTARIAVFGSAPAIPTAPLARTAPMAMAPPPVPPPAATLPLGAPSNAASPPFAPAQALVAGSGSYPPAHVPSSAPTASGGYPPLASQSAPPASAAKRSTSPVLLVAILLFAVLGGAAGALVYFRRQDSHAPQAATSSTGTATAASSTVAAVSPPIAELPVTSASATPPAPSAASPAAASSSASPASPAPSAAVPDLPPGMGRVRTTGAAPGRRIFVDERTVGQTPDAVVVKCGVRSIKLGSSGVARPVEVPCGADITVGDR